MYYKTITMKKHGIYSKTIDTLVKYDEKRKSPTNIQNVVYYNKYDTINQWRVDRQIV